MRRLGNLVKKYATLLSMQYKSPYSFILKAHVQLKKIACCIKFCSDEKFSNHPTISKQHKHAMSFG